MYLNRHAPNFLADMLESALEREPLDVATREWFIRGVVTYLRGNAKSLDAALGLSAVGQRGIRKVILLNERNDHIQESLRAIALDSSVSTWERCQRLAKQVIRLVPVWDARGLLLSPEADWPTWKRSLFKAWKTGIDIPGTPEGLLSVTKTNPRYSFSSGDLSILSRYI